MKKVQGRRLSGLLSGGDVDGFDAGLVEKARRLAQDPANAPADEVVTLPGALAEAVLDASVKAANPKLAERLLSSGNKELAKAAKRALYQLRSSGVQVTAPAKLATAASPAPPITPPEEWAALASPITGTGERAVLTVRPVHGGLEMFQSVISDEHGILQLATQSIGRSAYRKQLADIRKGAAGAIEITQAEAAQLLAEAAGRNVLSKTPFPPGAEPALRLLKVMPRLEAPAPLPGPLPEDAGTSREGHFLHNEPEILPWLPPEPELQKVGERAESILGSPLALTDAQKNEQILHAFNAAAHAFFTPPVAKLYARRLWAMADYFERTGRDRPAALARAEARRLFHGHNEPPSRFAEFFFEKILLLSQRTQAEGGQLPPPGTALPLAAPEPKGSLILP